MVVWENYTIESVYWKWIFAMGINWPESLKKQWRESCVMDVVLPSVLAGLEIQI